MNSANPAKMGFRSYWELRRAARLGTKRERAGNRMAKHMEDLGKWAQHLHGIASRVLEEKLVR